MNIAVFIKATTHHKGFAGLETLNKNLCEGLAAKGHKVTVFAPMRDLRVRTISEHNVEYVYVESVYRTLFQSFNRQNWFRKSLQVFEDYHGREPFDIVVSQSSAGLAVFKKRGEFGVKAVGISHGSILSELRTRFGTLPGLKGIFQLIKDTFFVMLVFFGRQREFVFGADKLVAVSEFVKRRIINETYCPDDHVVVIHNGSDFHLHVPRDPRTDSGGGRFVYVGRVTEEKGVGIFPKLLDLPEFSKYTLDIIGDGEYLEKLKQASVGKKIFFHGKLPYDQVARRFCEADVFLFPSQRVEGFPMVLVEAMFCGLPTVAYSVGGVPDAVVDGTTGFLVKPGDFDTFKTKALELMSNAALRKTMSAEAVNKANREFRLDIMVNKYENLFRELLADSRPQGAIL